MKYLLIFTLLITGLNSCVESEKTVQATDVNSIRNELLSKGKSIVWALNEGNVDTLMHDFWKSDSAFFLINGRKIQGYEQIKNRLIESMKYRKKLELMALTEDVIILSPSSATHVVEFSQAITDLNDSTSNYKGAWTAAYQKINDEWKVVFVHESYYPTDNN